MSRKQKFISTDKPNEFVAAVDGVSDACSTLIPARLNRTTKPRPKPKKRKAGLIGVRSGSLTLCVHCAVKPHRSKPKYQSASTLIYRDIIEE